MRKDVFDAALKLDTSDLGLLAEQLTDEFYKRRENAKRVVWYVADKLGFAYGRFREDDYVSAVELLGRKAKGAYDQSIIDGFEPRDMLRDLSFRIDYDLVTEEDYKNEEFFTE